uniref:Uncharacterized protein n=1 Tax=Zea mays TaxID=4577 RepID=C4J4J3_MAIZE|nr:unknown [Zea mays]
MDAIVTGSRPWSARRSGREPPRAAWAPSQGVRRQATRPSLPAATLCPATDISTSHMLGASCHSTKLPSWPRPPPPPPPGSCSMERRTRPDAYMLLTAPSSSFPHPVVALNCSMMYCADDATWRGRRGRRGTGESGQASTERSTRRSAAGRASSPATPPERRRAHRCSAAWRPERRRAASSSPQPGSSASGSSATLDFISLRPACV